MKNGVYGIDSISLAPVVAGSFPTDWTGTGCFSFKAIVKDSVTFNDAAAGTTDIEIEDSDDAYATLTSSLATKGFTVNTYDLSEEAYAGLMQYTKDSSTNWNNEPVKTEPLIMAARIVTKDMGDFPAKVFEWANMRIDVTKAGTIGKSGFPNLTCTFKQQVNADADGNLTTPARWGLASDVLTA